MAKVGEVRAKFTVDSKDFEAGIGRIESASQGLAVQVTGGFNKMEGELKAVGTAVKTAGAEAAEAAEKFSFERALGQGVALFQGIAGAVEGFRAEMNEAGEKADDLRDRLAATFGKLADEKAKLAESSLTLGFDADSTANALVTLHKFGADTEETLKRLQDAARFTNQDVASLAEGFGRFEKFGDAKSLKALQKELGVSAADMEKFGAKLKDADTVLIDNAANTKLASDALKAYMEQNFAGAAERQADAATHLAGELELLKREIGGNAVAFKESFAPALVSVVQSLREMPEGVKAAIGVGAELVGTFASMAASGLQAGSQLVILSQNATVAAGAKTVLASATNVLNIAMASLAGPMGAILITLGAIGVAVFVVEEEFKKLYEATDQLTNIEAKRLQGLHQQRDVLKELGTDATASAQQLLALGKTSADVTKVIQGLQEEAQNARNAGNTTLENEIEAKLRQAIAVRGILSKLAVDQKVTQDAEQAAADKLLDTYKKRQAAGVFASDKEQLAALDQVLAKISKQSDDYEELALKRIALARKVKVEEDKATEGQSKAAVEEKLHQIDLLSKAGEISKQQEMQRLQQVLAGAHVSAEQRKKIETEIATLKGQIHSKELADLKQHNSQVAAETKTNADKLRGLLKEQISGQKAEIAQEIEGLQGSITKDTTLPQIQKLLQQRLNLTIKEINSERDAVLESSKNAEVKAEAIRAAEAKIRAARRETANDLETERKKAKDKTDEQAKKDATEIEKLTKQTFDAQKTAIDQQVTKLEEGLGKTDVLPNIKKLLEQRLALVIKEIEAERDAILKANTSEDVRAAAVKAAEEKIKTAHGETTAKVEAETKKQKDALQSVADKTKDIADEIKSRVGGKNSPLYSDVTEGLGMSFGNFGFGDLKKPGQPQVTPTPQGPKATPVNSPGQQQPAQPLPAVDQGLIELSDRHAEKITSALRDAPMNITIQVDAGGKSDSKTFSGTASELARQSNTFNPDHMLGKL